MSRQRKAKPINDVKGLIKALKVKGCTISVGSKHTKVKYPGGQTQTLAVSSSDYRGVKNELARARRFLDDASFGR